MYGETLDMLKVETEVLAKKLSKFYVEVKKPQTNNNSSQSVNENQPSGDESDDNADYGQNTVKNIRGAINRHLADLRRDIDIVKDKEFKRCNSTLIGLFKERMEKGNHFKEPAPNPPIAIPDLIKIKSYFDRAPGNPIILRQCVWFNLALHYLSMRVEFHLLKRSSLCFNTDEHGIEYISLSQEILIENLKYHKRKKSQEIQDIYKKFNQLFEKRIYTTQSAFCPFHLIKLFLEKTPEDATGLFNHCAKDALASAQSNKLWYSSNPLGRFTFRRFMPDISKSAKLSQHYTAHNIRVTCDQAKTDPVLEQFIFNSAVLQGPT